MLTTLALALALSAAPQKSTFAPKLRPYDATHYKLEFTLGDEGAFTNKVSITLKPKSALGQVDLDLEKLDVKDVQLADGGKATFFVKDGVLSVKPAKALPAGKESTLVVTVTSKAHEQHEGFFVTWSPDDPNKTPYYFTHFEREAARKFYPCNDQPFDKATTEVFAVVPGDLQVLSNGKLEKDEAFSEGGKNLRRVHWVQDQPHSTYLVALAIGKFADVDVGAGVPSTLHVLPGTEDRAFVSSEATLAHLSAEAAYLGVKYPWAKYDQVAVPRFFWGGMENTSLVTVRESAMVLPNRNYVIGRPGTVGLVAHELAHQWFGDYVTLKWWDDTWLNEGFATFLGEKATQKYFDNDLVAVQRATDLQIYYMQEENGPRSHALKAPGLDPDQMFDATSYEKGAQILAMLELQLGAEDFKKGLKAYLEQFAYSNASSDDFFAVMGKTAKKDKEVKAFKDAWVTRRGYPIITPSFRYADGTLTVTIKQRPNHAGDKGAFFFKLPVVFHRTSEPTYTKEEVILVDKPEVTVKVQLPAPPTWVNWNKGALALAKVEPSAIGENEWTAAARGDDDPVWRLLAQYALMANFLDQDIKEFNKPTDAAMGAILDGLSSDPSPYVRKEMMDQLGGSRWPKLPSEFGPVVLTLAKRPEKLPEDALGTLSVRAAALSLLGKIDYAEGKKYVLSQLQKKDLDPNFIAGAALGVGRIGDTVALAELGAAMRQQKTRGTWFWKAAAQGLGSFQSAEVVPEIRDFLKEAHGNDDVARIIPTLLWDNPALRELPETATLIRDVALDESWGVDYRQRMLGVLDLVKTPAAKAVLSEIKDKSKEERVKGQAERVLAANFPAPPPEKKAPPKKK